MPPPARRPVVVPAGGHQCRCSVRPRLACDEACPDGGVLTAVVHARKPRRVKDLPHGRRPLRVVWDQRRWAFRRCRLLTWSSVAHAP